MSQHEPTRKARYWLGPLLVGACLATGYGITKRIDSFQGFFHQRQITPFDIIK